MTTQFESPQRFAYQTQSQLQSPSPNSSSQGQTPSQFNTTPARDVPRYEVGKFQIDWISCTVIFLPPFIVAYALWHGLQLQYNTFLLAIAFYAMNGIGVTVGYHRLFSHRSFSASWWLQAVMAVWGAGAFQGSIKWWGRNHRIHHRYVDTDKDPYNALRGFWYSHVGWMLMKLDRDLLGRVDIEDLHANSLVMFQHRHYLEFALIGGLISPALIAGIFWGDFLGGFIFAGLCKMMFVHHCTFFINSLAHTGAFGARQNFSNKHSSYDSIPCALFTLGEGYHNFHHEFAQDYRNGIEWYQWDPTKWIIRLCAACGLAWNLVRVPNDVINKNKETMREIRLKAELEECESHLKQLERKVAVPNVMTWSDFQAQVAAGRKLMVIGSYVLDMEKKVKTGGGYTHTTHDVDWMTEHPGGEAFLKMYIGKDATEAVTGGIYKHREGAVNFFQQLRVASIDAASIKKEL